MHYNTIPGLQVEETASPVGNGPADSWEDKADLSSAATTPDDEDVSMEDDSGEYGGIFCTALMCVSFAGGHRFP